MENDTAKFIKYIQDIFEYHDGRLYKKNKLCGYFDKGCNYFRLKIKSKSYLLHRIIFTHQKGYLPEFIDHKDRDKTNNRIENLREAPKKCYNTVNSKIRSDSSSGYKGVAWHSCGKWQSSVFKDGKRHYIGLFFDPKEAALAYNIKAKELFGEFVLLNSL